MSQEMFMYCGMRVYKAQQAPRYTLPEEIIPGVPWPPGFREEINEWAWDFLGWTCLVPRGQMYMIGRNTVIVHPLDFRPMVDALKPTTLWPV